MPMPVSPERLPQTATLEPDERNASLWQNSPGWRNLVATAAALTALAVAIPLIGAQSEKRVFASETSCPIKVPVTSTSLNGIVSGFLTAGQAQELVQVTQRQLQGTINPDYLSNLRVVVTSPSQLRYTVLVPQWMTVKIGDRIEFGTAHRAAGLPCHYIPNLITRIIAP